ncbi:MAG: aldehyde dehydrogenase [Deltaproteobacteria bacterium]|jgi:aldehyde dehydrogenase|nr:aldehyde dehydrogenase [Deltaproteobacteria bacterium]MBT4527152.1 aldehyde dehydrogenase [Deltaproteobacteria bacterium]
MDYSNIVQDVVAQVLQELDSKMNISNSLPTTGQTYGLFQCVDKAVAAAKYAQKQLSEAGIETREKIVALLKSIPIQNATSWAELELNETGVGRLDHKIAKLQIINKVPGVEALKSTLHSGDNGISMDELAPWGVIGCVTPVTHSIPTITANAINMIAAGNALVVNPHPSGYRCAAIAVETYNRAIYQETGIENLIALINPPTLETANAIFEHRDINLLVVTGGPFVARAALSQKKRAIVAGPGNPPVVVDETADLDLAARSIITGAAFDNNLLCIGEKEVFVVDQVFEAMMAAMERTIEQKAYRLNSDQIAALTEKAFVWKKDHYVVNGELVGKDCEVLAKSIGLALPPGQKIDLLYGETGEDNLFVPVEQMMPFVPFVRVPNVATAVEKALEFEHGFGHTAIIHSNNLATITDMGKRANTTVFVANGPSTGGLGLEGEGFLSYSLATPTGEGITSPLTFTRFRRMSICGSMGMV